jgi:hypothetical protein
VSWGLGPGAWGLGRVKKFTGVGRRRRPKQTKHIYIYIYIDRDIYIYIERYIKMLPYMYLLPLSDDEVERLDAADAGAAVFYL